MLDKCRNDFPMLKQRMHGKPLIYLDSAATAQKPQSVIDAVSGFYTNSYGTVHRAVYELAKHSTEHYQKVREKVRAFLGAAKSAEVIFTRGTTESINLVAYSFGKRFVKAGDEILISAMEHHSNIVPWQILCEDRGAHLKVIPFKDNGELDLEAYAALLSDKTRLVACCHISNAIGTLNPIKQMAALAHRAGAYFLADGAQAAPHLAIDVQDLDVDFYVFSGHKAFGPTGIGVLYGKESVLELMPPYQGGGDMIETVSFEKTTYNVLPLKFEAGTPMIAEVMGLGAAIDYLVRLGMHNIHRHEEELRLYAEEKLKSIEGLQIIGNAAQKGAIVSFLVKGIHPLDLGTFLDLDGVAVRTGHHCAQPLMKRFGITGTARASFALYNTKKEVDRFSLSLETVIRKLHAH